MLPIVFMVYNRPDKVKTILNALLECDGIGECEVFAFSDGAKNDSVKQKVDEVRDVLRSYSQIINMHIVERKTNYGCSRNVAESVSEVLSNYEYTIYLEDDILPHKDFIKYMSYQLEKYKEDNSVFSINSYNQLEKSNGNGDETYRSEKFSSWGSAIYRRGWENVEFVFDKENQLKGYEKEYLKRIDGKKVKEISPDEYLTYLEHKHGFTTWNKYGDMWDLQCFYYMLANHMVAITPYRAYTTNIGNDDNSGIHIRTKGAKKAVSLFLRKIMVYTHTTGIVQTFYKSRNR